MSAPVLQQRFRLLPNTADAGSRKVYLFGGILLMPLLLVGIVLKLVLELSPFSIVAAWGVLAVVLINIYVFCQNAFSSYHGLFLLLDEHYLQVIGRGEIYLQADWPAVKLEWINNSNCQCLAVKIMAPDFSGLTIGIKYQEASAPKAIRQLQQPDYWLDPNGSAEAFIQQLHHHTKMRTAIFLSSNVARLRD